MTPAELITGIVTEEGVVRAPFASGLRDAVEGAHARWAATPGFRAVRPVAAAAPDEIAEPDPVDGSPVGAG